MLECIITKTKDLEPVTYDWGGVKWVANNELAPGCGQSFGLVHILPGKTNPEHWHTAAEEILYMLEGECDVRVGDRRMKVVPGQTLVIPQGVSTRSPTAAGSRSSTSAPSPRACGGRCSRIPASPGRGLCRASTRSRGSRCPRCPWGRSMTSS